MTSNKVNTSQQEISVYLYQLGKISIPVKRRIFSLEFFDNSDSFFLEHENMNKNGRLLVRFLRISLTFPDKILGIRINVEGMSEFRNDKNFR